VAAVAVRHRDREIHGLMWVRRVAKQSLPWGKCNHSLGQDSIVTQVGVNCYPPKHFAYPWMGLAYQGFHMPYISCISELPITLRICRSDLVSVHQRPTQLSMKRRLRILSLLSIPVANSLGVQKRRQQNPSKPNRSNHLVFMVC
jgi:hypothetical protein